MQINGTGPVNNLSSVKPASRPGNTPKAAEASAAGASDELTLSSEAQALTGGSDVRMEKVNQIKQQIAAGTYETPEKLDAALDRLLDQLG